MGRGPGRVKGNLKITTESAVDKDQATDELQQQMQSEGHGTGSREFDPNWYMVDESSVGGRLKKACDVVRTRVVDHKKKKLNLNCRVETVGWVIQQFCDKKKWVDEMGFSSLCHLYDKGLPRILCYWLATRVDVANRCLRCRDGKVFPLTKVQVYWVLGIPIGPKVVPRECTTESMKKETSMMFDMYKTASPSGTAGIKRSTILALVEGPPDDELVFKRAFLMMVLGDFLCPTTCHRLSVGLLPAITVALKAGQYDWCAFVVDHLLSAISNFAQRFYNDGYAAGCGGYTYFLAIVYLDRLRRPPVQWGMLPRYQVWTWKEINKASKDDQLPGLDFGKLGCYDVAYRENHPLEGRDELPSTMLTNVIVDKFVSVMRSIYEGNGESSEVPPERRGRKRRGPTSSFTPYEYVQRNLGACTAPDASKQLLAPASEPYVESSIQPCIQPLVQPLAQPHIQHISQQSIEHSAPLPVLPPVAPCVDSSDHLSGHPSDQHSAKGQATKQPSSSVDCRAIDEHGESAPAKDQGDDYNHSFSNSSPPKIKNSEAKGDSGHEVQETSAYHDPLVEILSWCDKLPDISTEHPQKNQESYDEVPMDVSDFDQVEFSNVILQNEGLNVDKIVSSLSGYEHLQTPPLTLSKYVIGVSLPPGQVHTEIVNAGCPYDSPDRSYSLYEDVESNKEVGEGPAILPHCENPEDDCVTSSAGEKSFVRSRTPRKTKSCFKLSASYIQMWRPPQIRRFKKRLLSFISIAGGELVSNDTVILQCNGHQATIHNCTSVLSTSCTVSIEYVKVAVHLYKKVWDKKHKDRSQRFIMDPDFAINGEVLNLDDGGRLSVQSLERFGWTFRLHQARDINMVFVPVLKNNHWWCAVFSVISSEVAIIDGMDSTQAAVIHQLDLVKLKHAMDDLLRFVIPSWRQGNCLAFTTYNVEMPFKAGLFDSGILMLVAMKRRAARLGFNVYMESICEEMPWLLCEDIMNEFNDAKGSVKGLLAELMP